MRVRAIALCAVTACALTAVAACGTARSGGSSEGSVPRASTSAAQQSVRASQPGHASHRRTLTVANNGAKVRLRRGQTIVVILASPAQMWQPPRASGLALRRTTSRGGYPLSQVALASFVAVRPGLATLTSTTDARCLHAQPPCEIAQQLWAVTVIVTEH
jgi:hypothetical protein